MTGTDVASIMNAMNRDNDGFLEGNGIIILILFFLIFGFGGNGFGSNGNALTQSELQLGLYNQTTDANLRDIRNAQCGTNQAIMESRYDSQLASANTNSLIQSCCCSNEKTILQQTNELSTQMTQNTQAILDKLCSQEIQNLRDEVAGYRETLNNSVQTQNILNTILTTTGRWYANPTYYSSCGCNNNVI